MLPFSSATTAKTVFPTATQEYATLRPEGVTVLANGHVYAAISQEGIVKYDGQSWALKNAGLSINNQYRRWTAVDGYLEGTQDIIYAGVNNTGGNANGANYSSVWRSADGGDTWSALVDVNANVSDTVYGKSHDWWYRIDAFAQGGLGRKVVVPGCQRSIICRQRPTAMLR